MLIGVYYSISIFGRLRYLVKGDSSVGSSTCEETHRNVLSNNTARDRERKQHLIGTERAECGAKYKYTRVKYTGT